MTIAHAPVDDCWWSLSVAGNDSVITPDDVLFTAGVKAAVQLT